MRTAWLFLHGVDIFALKFYVDRVGSHQPFLATQQKTRDTGLPNGEDRIPLRSLILAQYWNMMNRWMEAWICRSIYSTQ